MLFFSAALMLAGLEPAEPSAVEALELSWDAPPQCPTGAQVRAEVHELVLGAQDPQSTRVVAKVSALDGGGWRLELDVDNELVSGRRTLLAESCADLAHATAMVAAIAIDPFSGAHEGQAETAPQQTTAVQPKPTPAPRKPAPSPPRKETPDFTAPWSVGAAGGAGWSSGATGAVRLIAGWQRRRLAVRFGSDLWLPRRYEDAEFVARGVSVGHALAHLRVCFVPGWQSLAVPLCGGARAGISFARAFGVQQGSARGSVASAALASAGLRWTPGQTNPNLSLFFDAEPAVQLTRPRFHTADRPPAYTGSSVALLLLAGAEVHFGRKK